MKLYVVAYNGYLGKPEEFPWPAYSTREDAEKRLSEIKRSENCEIIEFLSVASEENKEPKINAPWTDEQLESLKKFQACSYVHPFTSENGTPLIPIKNGWVETEDGEIVQFWAHSFMCYWGR